MTTRIYRSTDLGAPQLSDSQAGDLAIILKACLVTGYGAKSPAGWSVEWEGVNQIALKMGAGSTGMIMTIDDTLSYKYAIVHGCKSFTSMVDVDEKFPVDGAYNDYVNHWYKRYSSAENYGSWTVIASESFVYWFQNTATSVANTANEFFGDYECVNPTWEYRTALTGRITNNPSSSISSYIYRSLLYNDDAQRFLRRSWSGVKSAYVKFDMPDGAYSLWSGRGYGVNPLDGKISLNHYDIYCNNAHMGKLPNAYTMNYPFDGGSQPFFSYGGSIIDAADSPTGKSMFTIGTSNSAWIFVEFDE